MSFSYININHFKNLVISIGNKKIITISNYKPYIKVVSI